MSRADHPRKLLTIGSGLITATLQQSSTGTSTSTISSNVTSTIIIRGDTGYIAFGVSQAILTGVLEQYKDKIVSQVQNASTGSLGVDSNNYLQSKVEAIPGTAHLPPLTSWLRV